MAATRPLRLVYFAVRAKAEPCRMILEHGGVPYVDVSVQQQFNMPWPEVKRQGLVPFGQLPVLDVGDGELVAQEAAICRYCADLVPGLLPSDSLERAKCEALFHAAEELFVCNPLVNVYRGEDFEGKKREFLDNVLPRRLRNFARILRDSGGPFTMGRSPNYADFKWYHHLSNVSLLEDGALKASLGSEEASLHDAVVAFMAAVEGLEGVGEYLRRRPKAVDVGTKPMLDPPICGSRFQE